MTDADDQRSSQVFLALGPAELCALAGSTVAVEGAAPTAPRTSVPEASAKAAMSAAMNYHRFAQSLCATTLLRDGALPLSSFEALTILLEHFPCSALTSLVETVTKRYADTKNENDRARLVVDRASSDRAVRMLWSCASDKIAEAERIMASRLHGPVLEGER